MGIGGGEATQGGAVRCFNIDRAVIVQNQIGDGECRRRAVAVVAVLVDVERVRTAVQRHRAQVLAGDGRGGVYLEGTASEVQRDR